MNGNFSSPEKNRVRDITWQFARFVPEPLRLIGDVLILPSRTGPDIPKALELFPPKRVILVDTYDDLYDETVTPRRKIRMTRQMAAGVMAQQTIKWSLQTGGGKHFATRLLNAAPHIRSASIAFAHFDFCTWADMCAPDLIAIAPALMDGSYFVVTCLRARDSKLPFPGSAPKTDVQHWANSLERINRIAQSIIAGRKSTAGACKLRCCGVIEYNNSNRKSSPMLTSFWRLLPAGPVAGFTTKPWCKSAKYLKDHKAVSIYKTWFLGE